MKIWRVVWDDNVQAWSVVHEVEAGDDSPRIAWFRSKDDARAYCAWRQYNG